MEKKNVRIELPPLHKVKCLDYLSEFVNLLRRSDKEATDKVAKIVNVLEEKDKPIKIKWMKETSADYMYASCPKCNFEILENYLNYCPWCGQAIKIVQDEEEKDDK